MARVAVPVVSRFMRRMAESLSAGYYVTYHLPTPTTYLPTYLPPTEPSTEYRVSAFGVLCARAALADEPKRGV